MNESRARELFLEFHRGSLSAPEDAALRAFLRDHPVLQRDFEEFTSTLNTLDAMPVSPPTARLRANVFAAIDAEKRVAASVSSAAPLSAAPKSREAAARPPANRRWFWVIQIASACGILAAGYFAGTRQSASPAQPGNDPTNYSAQNEIAELRRQVEEMSQLVGRALLQQQAVPTTDRLKSVLASASVENPNDRIINELIGSLALDPSVNVRLTALEALYAHADQEVVRAGVLAALPREQNPLVQVAMIDFLVAARDGAAAPALDRIYRSDTTDRNVRAAAMRALHQL